MKRTLEEIAHLVQGQLLGNGYIEITGLAKLEDAREGDLSFIAEPSYDKYVDISRASAFLVYPEFPPTQKNIIKVSNPYKSFLQLVQFFYPITETLEKGIHPTAIIGQGTRLGSDIAIGAYVVVGRNCVIGERVRIYPGVTIGDEVQIGADSVLYHQVSIRERCRIGKNVFIHCGAVIGSDGFGFFKQGEGYEKIPQLGIVVIEDEVEIGANCAIDRATFGETRIRRGAKLDNLIQVAHNVEIGENTVIAAQAGISGSTRIGKGVSIGGQAGFVGHIEIGDYASIGAQAGVTKSVPAKIVVSGYPARPHFQARREEAVIRRLPELLKTIKELEKRVAELEQMVHASEKS